MKGKEKKDDKKRNNEVDSGELITLQFSGV